VKKATKTITAGAASLTVRIKLGTYAFFCPVEGHEAAGMRAR
jgi:uncharacterized cupredoxin-like copper-binding protein